MKGQLVVNADQVRIDLAEMQRRREAAERLHRVVVDTVQRLELPQTLSATFQALADETRTTRPITHAAVCRVLQAVAAFKLELVGGWAGGDAKDLIDRLRAIL